MSATSFNLCIIEIKVIVPIRDAVNLERWSGWKLKVWKVQTNLVQEKNLKIMLRPPVVSFVSQLSYNNFNYNDNYLFLTFKRVIV